MGFPADTGQEIKEYANLAAFPATGISGIIYVALDTVKQYIWSGSAYVVLVGAVNSVAGRTGAVTLTLSDVGVNYTPENVANKDTASGYAGLTAAFGIIFKNAANTFTNFLINATTAARTWTFPDKDGTVAMTSDITGTNSGTNTGDITLSAIGSTANANGASLSGQALTLQPASSSFGGIITTGTQTFTGSKTFAGTMSIGTGTGSGSLSPLEIIGTDGGLAITSTNTVAGTESYVAGFLKNSEGNYTKIGATAFQFTSDSTTNGYASWNVHTTSFLNGVSSDNFALAVWAKHGAAFFPPDLGSSSAPGDTVLKINGVLETTGNTLINGATSDSIHGLVVGGGIVTNAHMGTSAESNTNFQTLSTRNTSTGASAVNRISIGNNTSAFLLDIFAYGGNHSTKPNQIEILNQYNAALSLGANGDPHVTILGNGNVSFGLGTTPSAVIHIKAGTAAASSAPLKFTSGTLNTTPEAGAVEFLTDTFYATITTGAVRKAITLREPTIFTAISSTILITQENIEVTASDTTQTLYTAVGNDGKIVRIDNSSAGDTTILSNGGLLWGETSQTLPANSTFSFRSNGTDWRPL